MEDSVIADRPRCVFDDLKRRRRKRWQDHDDIAEEVDGEIDSSPSDPLISRTAPAAGQRSSGHSEAGGQVGNGQPSGRVNSLKDKPRFEDSDAKIFVSKKTSRLIVYLRNGDTYRYQVANPPTNADSSGVNKNGQLSPGSGSLTILKRCASSSSRSLDSSQLVSQSLSGTSLHLDGIVDLSNITNLPAKDTAEATHVCSVRLRKIIPKLLSGEISNDILIQNLEYTASVLEAVYIDETRELGPSQADSGVASLDGSDDRSPGHPPLAALAHRHRLPRQAAQLQKRLCDEDDELSEVEPDTVPSEVRDWLALTFTRSMSNMKRRRNDKPKFRSVAQAIRAGLMVDRIYRRMSSTVGLHIPPNVLMLLKTMDDWSFDAFSVNESADGHAIKYVGYELLQRYDLISKYKINTQTLENFLLRVEQGYSKHNNPYHNLVHAADVTQTTHHIMSHCGLMLWLTDLEIFATLIAAIIHDFEHTGTTNNFHINTSSDMALLYNDRAVLENHHVSTAFRIMKEDDFNILSNLKREEYRDFRALVIDMVLATDMSFHFQQIKNMKNLISLPDIIDKSKAMSLVIHCADISHPAKAWPMHSKWTELLLEEFFRQGDREAELGVAITPLCDRNNTLVAESQIGFIDFIVDPSFQVMGDMLEKIIEPLQQRNACATAGSVAVAVDVADKATSTTSLRSSRSSTPDTPKSVSSAGASIEVKRCWVACLAENKSNWKERAARDAIERKTQKLVERVATARLDTPSSSPEQGESPRLIPLLRPRAIGPAVEKHDVMTETRHKSSSSATPTSDASDARPPTPPPPPSADSKTTLEVRNRQTSTSGLAGWADSVDKEKEKLAPLGASSPVSDVSSGPINYQQRDNDDVDGDVDGDVGERASILSDVIDSDVPDVCDDEFPPPPPPEVVSEPVVRRSDTVDVPTTKTELATNNSQRSLSVPTNRVVLTDRLIYQILPEAHPAGIGGSSDVVNDSG